MAQIKKISTELQLLDKFLDTSGDAGTSGQVLSSTGTGINWVSGGSLPGGPYLPLSAGSSYPLTGTLYGTSTNFSGNGDYAGSMTLGTGASTAEASLTIGQGRTDSGYSYIDLVGGTTYSDYGLRIIRGNTGSNADSSIIHRGQGNLNIQTTDSASILLKTAGNEKMRITSTGNVGIGTTSPVNKQQNKYTSVAINSMTATAGTASTNWNRNAGLLIEESNSSNGLALGVSQTANDRKSWIQSGHPDSAANNLGVLSLNPLGGNVGIGTTSPATKFVVSDAGGTGLEITPQDANTRISLVAYDRLDFAYRELNFDGYNYSFRTSGNVKAVMLNTGNVGIGTTSPSQKLHLQNGILLVNSNTPVSTGIWMPDTNGNPSLRIVTDQSSVTNSSIVNAWGNSSNAGVMVGSTRNDGFAFQVRSGVTLTDGFANDTGNSRMVVLGNGNVGIGTTSPANKLTVNGDIGYTGVIGQGSIYGNTGNSSYANMQLYDPATGYSTFNNQSYGYYLQTGGSTKLTILNNGNVGIGTTSPSAKLSVIGDINFGGGNNNGIIEVSGSGDLIFKYKGSDPALTLDGGAVKTIVHNRLDALNIVNINNPSNNESILNIRDDGTNGHIAFENSSEITGIIASDTEIINFRVGDGVGMSDSPVLTLLPNRIGINTTSPNSNVALEVDGRVLIKDSTGVADFYLGNYATANHFRFHTNNANTYFDMNCGNIYWRDGASTRYTFFPSTANMTVNGTITQNSDIRIKENIVEIGDCISKVQAMKGVYYNRTDFNTETKKVGVIAQDVEAVLPELIIESPEDGLKSVAYSELTAVLINAIKEQQEIIEDLKTRITKLEN